MKKITIVLFYASILTIIASCSRNATEGVETPTETSTQHDYHLVVTSKPEVITKKSMMIFDKTGDTLITENQRLIRCELVNGGKEYIKYPNFGNDSKALALLDSSLPAGYCFEVICSKDNDNDYLTIASFILREFRPVKRAG